MHISDRQAIALAVATVVAAAIATHKLTAFPNNAPAMTGQTSSSSARGVPRQTSSSNARWIPGQTNARRSSQNNSGKGSVSSVKLQRLVETSGLVDANGKVWLRQAIPGDGDCMFKSLVCGLYEIVDAKSRQAKELTRKLRHSIAEELVSPAYDNGIRSQLQQEEVQRDLRVSKDHWKSPASKATYVNGVRGRLWGDDVSLSAFNAFSKCEVIVYQMDDNGRLKFQVRMDGQRQQPTICLLETKRVHFDLLHSVAPPDFFAKALA